MRLFRHGAVWVALAGATMLFAAKTPAPSVIKRGPDGYTIVSLQEKAGRKDVRKGEMLTLYGLTDGAGREILPPRHERLERLHGTQFIFGVRKPEDRQVRVGLIDAATGRVILPPQNERIEVTRDGYIRYGGGSSLTGLLDAGGKELLPPRFQAIGEFSEDLLPVRDFFFGWWVDRNFQPVLQDKKFSQVWDFREGKATVATSRGNGGFVSGFKTIDRAGNILGATTDPQLANFVAPANTDLRCDVCDGSGGRYETTQESSNSYADIGGHAGVTKAVRWTQSKRIGNCFTCNGTGRIIPPKK